MRKEVDKKLEERQFRTGRGMIDAIYTGCAARILTPHIGR